MPLPALQSLRRRIPSLSPATSAALYMLLAALCFLGTPQLIAGGGPAFVSTTLVMMQVFFILASGYILRRALAQHPRFAEGFRNNFV